MSEIWKDIKNFEGYQVSDKGRVRSFHNKNHGLKLTPSILSPTDDGNGYLKVTLRKNGKAYCKKVHRLVAEAFIPNDDPNLTVDHIKDGKEGKLDNSVENLRWLSRYDNLKKAYDAGIHNERIAAIREPMMLHDKWSGDDIFCGSITEAAKVIGVHYTTISHAMSANYYEANISHFHVRFASGEERLLYGEFESDY